MRTENLILAFLVILILLTLVSIDPYRTGYLIMPSAVALEAAIFIILISLFFVLIMLVPKKNYHPF